MSQIVDFGLNKEARVRYERLAGEPAVLDPDFPYIDSVAISNTGIFKSPAGFNAQYFEAHISLPDLES